MAKYTITYDEGAEGFTSFHSYFPDFMASMNGEMFSTKDGQLWIHNDADNPIFNNFYGTQYTTTVTTILNKEPSDIKIISAIDTESNKAFDMVVKSYLNNEDTSITQSELDVLEFENREGKWYAYVRKNELTGDYTAHSAYGLGEGSAAASATIQFETTIPTSLLSYGDELLDSSEVSLGNVVSVDKVNNTITMDQVNTIAANTFIFGKKTARIEGSEIRGYNFEIKITDNTTTETKLFALNAEMSKSFHS